MKKIFTAAVMCATALSPIVNATAYAAVTGIGTAMADAPDPMTVGQMESQCAAAVLVADLDGPGADNDQYSADVVEGTITLFSGPTEVGTEADRTNLINRVGAGTFTPGVRFIAGNPYRNGGSVNMFGVQQATGGSFSNSMYDFTADFSSTFAHAFSCAISVENYNPPVFVPGTPLQGMYVVNPDANGNEEAKQNSCNSFNAQGPGFAHYGFDHGQCLFITTAPAVPDSFTPAFFDPPASAGSVAGTPVNQTQSDSLMAHETFGAGFTISETVILGQVAVCISPSKTVKGGTPGAWANHNGYLGDKCTTTWFNTGGALGVDNLNLQGTFISVPLA